MLSLKEEGYLCKFALCPSAKKAFKFQRGENVTVESLWLGIW